MTIPPEHRWLRWPDGDRRLGYGADYNPEQWPREVWAEDVRLMRRAGVNIVSLAIFSWARIQPAEHTWDFAWLDEIIDLLHEHGIAVDLATATASPPPWLTTKHPEILPVDRLGHTVWPGARQHWRPTSPVFRRYALGLVERLAQRYGQHPAVVAWHVSNELGCHNVYDYSDDAAVAFREWLRRRYGTVEALNEAWATAFWSQRYGRWEEVLPPRLVTSFANPTQQLDFMRFSSDALKEHLVAEREVLRRITPGIPVTTNFMVMGETKAMNYADWAAEIDFVSNDHYRTPGPLTLVEQSFSANLTGSIAGGRPWFLMEHSTSAVNWQPVNLAKRPGALAGDSLTHVAYGADAVCYFQWRQSRGGAEKYHSAMVPHAGEDSRLFADVTALGGLLAQLAPVTGSRRAPAPAAIVFDWESWWAVELDSHPSSLLRYRAEALAWYAAFHALGVRVDVIPAGAPIEDHALVVAPTQYVLTSQAAARLRAYVEAGGHLLTTFFSGIVDENDHVHLGGYPGALRELLGIRVEEFAPLLPDDVVELDDGTVATSWSEAVELGRPDVDVLRRYASGDHAHLPAVTRRTVGAGSATYVSTEPQMSTRQSLLAELLDHAGVASDLPEPLRGTVEHAVRRGPQADHHFLLNHADTPVELGELGGEILAATPGAGSVLPPRGVLVLTVARRQHDQDDQDDGRPYHVAAPVRDPATQLTDR